MQLRRMLALVGIAALFASFAGPAFASNPAGSNLVVTCGGSNLPCNQVAVPVGGVITINMCMSTGTGTILNTDSGLGTSGLGVQSPGGVSPVNPTGEPTYWTFTPAAFAQIPTCGQGLYSVQFGGNTAGWAKLSGPTVSQTAETGMYKIDVNFKQGTAVFDASFNFGVTPITTPEFSIPLLAVVGTSMLGLVLVRKKFARLV